MLLALALACILPELALQGADLGLWGSARWRPLAYQNGGFWTGLLRDWRPNWPAQPWTMFLTHGFLHAGLLHLLANMMAFLALGGPLARGLGAARFAALHLWLLAAEGLGFAALGPVDRPMVGASGVLFGLAVLAALAAAGARWRAGRRGAAAALLAAAAAGGAALNLAMDWTLAGGIAWQTHLGGALGGLAAAPLLMHRLRG